jgi:hypothetical protein
MFIHTADFSRAGWLLRKSLKSTDEYPDDFKEICNTPP